MKHFALAALLSLSVTGVAAADVTLSDDNATVTHDCAADGALTVAGNNITVTLTGTCTDIVMSGNTNTLTGSTKAIMLSGNANTASLDVVDKIVASGNMNTATWKRTSEAIVPVKPVSGTTTVRRITWERPIPRTTGPGLIRALASALATPWLSVKEGSVASTSPWSGTCGP